MFARVNLIELVKDPLDLILRDPNSCVSNLMEDVIVFLAGADFDLTSVRGKLDGVREEIKKDVMKSVPVGVDVEVIWYVELDGYFLFNRLDFIDIISHNFREMERLLMNVQTA